MGLFTKPKKRLDPELFDENKKLFPDVQRKLLHMAYTTIPEAKTYGLFIIGTSIGYTWEADSDIDINLILNEKALEGAAYWAPYVKESNGELLSDTLHPVNFFVQNYRVPDWEDDALGVYDLIKNDWVVPPPSPDSIPNFKEQNMTDLVVAKHYEEKIKGLIRDLTRAYNRFKETKDDSWRGEMESYLNLLLDVFNELDKDRKAQYDTGWGTPRYSANNVIFKYINRNDYLSMLDELKRYYSGSL